MKLTPRTILIAGTLACIVAAWSGFSLGGGSLNTAMGPVTTAARMEHPQVVQPASPTTPAAHSQKFSARFTDASSAQGTAPDSMLSVSMTSTQVAPAALKIEVDATNPPASPPTVRRRTQHAAAEETPPHYPLVMLDLPPAVLGSQEGLTATVDRLREKFIADVGGDQQNPADPAYLERWTHGVSDIDEQLRSAIGWQAYNTLLAAAHDAQKAAH